MYKEEIHFGEALEVLINGGKIYSELWHRVHKNDYIHYVGGKFMFYSTELGKSVTMPVKALKYSSWRVKQ